MPGSVASGTHCIKFRNQRSIKYVNLNFKLSMLCGSQPFHVHFWLVGLCQMHTTCYCRAISYQVKDFIQVIYSLTAELQNDKIL
jgi:hypothetical protein